ncbi:LysR family transcriptional regulator [Cupriavidus oxalaticus]|jgi:DNA-binding transcriptional LysR family regulator|uniref:LysR family transcriptional regulator n=1 Tax=Cupriavidus oxalaticus TaxID=96344 RepID=A0A375FTB4_9BURK|nr:LysR family transcriptional regulator [Cupriavidus oxalaticus]QRQ83849.1 LysR family transcriptional regulator [Cupriavidus oxalaticus]QRQ92062.1 LysR family transcriptional regulator [Cupriavidus oxalaticus]WQD86660.1 LysR family transcriptional regulator [Cupriavidus oxalaticus]SPC10460.1 putative transcriptional regulator, LysR family [Cupriavidus oxalaticus]SPC19335.1 putative transcriptional regulator, LysR family [Cupriavidus oxalaticus]
MAKARENSERLAKEITLRQFRYFVAAAETGQFSMAATAEHVSQSAVTNAVLALEQRLAVRLFERRPHGVTLTAEGHLFYQHARQILDSVEDALREPRFQVHGLQGSVRLAASYTVLGYFLPGLLARFRTNYPDIELDLLDMDRPDIERAVLAGEIELGIALLSNLERPQRFKRHTLMRSRRQLWTSASHPLLEVERPSLRDIAAYPYILITVDEAEESTMRYWRSLRLAPNIAFRTGSMEALRGLVAHGFGVTVLSDMVYRPWSLEGKQIEARPIANAVPDMEVGMLWQPGRKLGKPADALREFLIHACGS